MKILNMKILVTILSLFAFAGATNAVEIQVAKSGGYNNYEEQKTYKSEEKNCDKNDQDCISKKTEKKTKETKKTKEEY